MTKHQIDLMLILSRLCGCIGYYQGALRGTYINCPEAMTKIEEHEKKTSGVLKELEDKILEDAE